MYLKNKVFLSFCAIWAAFLCIMSIGAHTYFLNSLLHVQSGQENQDIMINHYAMSQVINYYLVAFIFFGLLFATLGWYLLRSVFLRHWANFKNQLHVIYKTSDYVRRARLDEKDELYFVAKQFNQMMDTIQKSHEDLMDKAEKINQLFNKISSLEQRAVKADQADSVFHAIYDLLNGIVTSVYVVKEKIENSKAEKLTDLAAVVGSAKRSFRCFYDA